MDYENIYPAMICTAFALSLLTFFLLIKIQIDMAKTFEEIQDALTKTNTALDNISSEMDAFKIEIEDLKKKLEDSGLTAEQEQILSDGIDALKTRAENISTAIEGETPDA